MSDRYTLCELSTARPATSPNWPSAEPGPPKVVRNLPLLLNFSMRKFAGGGTGKAQSGPRGRQSGGPREACPVPSATYTFPERSTATDVGCFNVQGLDKGPRQPPTVEGQVKDMKNVGAAELPGGKATTWLFLGSAT